MLFLFEATVSFLSDVNSLIKYSVIRFFWNKQNDASLSLSHRSSGILKTTLRSELSLVQFVQLISKCVFLSVRQ